MKPDWDRLTIARVHDYFLTSSPAWGAIIHRLMVVSWATIVFAASIRAQLAGPSPSKQLLPFVLAVIPNSSHLAFHVVAPHSGGWWNNCFSRFSISVFASLLCTLPIVRSGNSRCLWATKPGAPCELGAYGRGQPIYFLASGPESLGIRNI